MTIATKHLHNRIALVFDFDATLAPDSYDVLLRRCGLDPGAFTRERVQPLANAGWDGTLARFHCLIEESESREDFAITHELLQEVGRKLEPYEGVPEMFSRVRQWAHTIVPDIEVEFYVLTAGFVDIHRATSIADNFVHLWGSEFHFDEGGEIAFAKQMITFPEKVRYLLQLAKGLGTEGVNAPADVYREVPPEEVHIPLDQIVYVGDGGSDMPVFSLLGEHCGLAIGVYKSETPDGWSAASKEHPGRRVQNLAAVDYREGSELMRSLQLCVESICKRVALRKLSVRE